MTIDQTQRLLTLAGTLPFILAAVFYRQEVIAGYAIADIISVYAVAIISFVAGMQWQNASGQPRATALGVLAASNLLTLCAWVACLVAPATLAFVTYAACFAILLAIDIYVLKLPQTVAYFFKTRLMASSVVIFCLGLLLWQAARGLS